MYEKMKRCINCGKKATSFDGLWCLKCLGDEAIYPDDYPKEIIFKEKKMKKLKHYEHFSINLNLAIRHLRQLKQLRKEDNKKIKMVSFGGKFLDTETTIRFLEEKIKRGQGYMVIGKCDNQKRGICFGHKEEVKE